MKLLFLIADNPYQTTTHFAKGFINALKNEGMQVEAINVNPYRFQEVMTKVFNEKPDATCSFSDFKINGVSLGNAWNIPHISLLIDPAFYFSHHLKGPNSLVTTIDEQDAAWIALKGKNALFFPHGVTKQEAVYSANCQFEITMIGSCNDPEEIRKKWRKSFSKQEVDFLEESCHQILFEGKSIGQAVCEGNFKNGLFLFLELDRYITSKDRIELLNSLKGFSVHTWGKGPWKKLVPHASHHQILSYESAIDVLAQSKIVINTNLRFKSGSHERVFQSLLNHSAAVTTENAYMQSQFEENEGVLFYKPGKWEEIREKVANLLLHPSDYYEQVQLGHKKILDHHCWDSRAAVFVPWLKQELCKIFN